MARAGLSEDRVVDAAATIADAEGLEAITLTRLAADLGVRPPSLYKHVDCLNSLRRALALRGLTAANDRLTQATVGKSGEEALLALAHAYWQFARERPGLYAASLLPALPGDREVASAGDALLQTLLAVLAGYRLEGEEALHASRGLRAIIHGFVSLNASGAFRLQHGLDESFDRLMKAFAANLKTQATQPA